VLLHWDRMWSKLGLCGVLTFAVIAQAFAAVWCREDLLLRARTRAKSSPWARAIADQIIADADRWLASPPPFPDVLTGYFHDYFCPVHAVQLTFDPAEPHRHRCPVDGAEYRGEKYDEAWAYLVHFTSAERLPGLAVAFALTDDARYAEAALQWLRKIRDRYASFPLHGSHAGRGRLMGQSLDEAVWAIHATRAYDILRQRGAISEFEHRSFVRLLWQPMYRLLATEPQFRGRIHNISCWHVAAMASIAILIGNQSMLRYALEDPVWGLRAQVLRGTDEDGIWYEGSLSYHFYALEALMAGAHVARNEGLSLGDAGARLGKMLHVPLALMDRRGGFPALNDGWPNLTLASYARLYEEAQDILPEAGIDSLWASFLPSRQSLEALLFGPDSLPSVAVAQESVLLRHSGLAVLREGDLYVLLDFAPHGGGHGHFDKLQLVFSWRGRWISPDFGTAGYGIPAYKEWFQKTACHNTVSVDGRCQSSGAGELVAFGGAGGWQVVRARTREVYPDVELDRCVSLSEGRVIVVDWIRSRARHRYHWHFRAEGEVGLPLARELLKPAHLAGDGYQHYTDVRLLPTADGTSVSWKTEAGPLALHLATLPDDSVFVGQEPGIPMYRKYPFVLLSRWADTAVIVASFVFGDASPAEVRLQEEPARARRISIRMGVGNEPVVLHLAIPGEKLQLGESELDASTALEVGSEIHPLGS